VVTQRERSERTVAAILEAGRALMTASGYVGVTVDDVVARAGVAKGAFYHHFSSKQALLDAVVDQVQAEIADQLRADRRPEPLSGEDLAAALESYLECAAHPDRRRLLLVEGPEVLGWARWREIDDAYFASMTRAALEAIMPTPDPVRVTAATRLLLGAVMEAALAVGNSAQPQASVARYSAVLRDLVHGLATGTDAARAAARRSGAVGAG
jgi:AcrR family transcriptional regulator